MPSFATSGTGRSPSFSHPATDTGPTPPQRSDLPYVTVPKNALAQQAQSITRKKLGPITDPSMFPVPPPAAPLHCMGLATQNWLCQQRTALLQSWEWGVKPLPQFQSRESIRSPTP